MDIAKLVGRKNLHFKIVPYPPGYDIAVKTFWGWKVINPIRFNPEGFYKDIHCTYFLTQEAALDFIHNVLIPYLESKPAHVKYKYVYDKNDN